MDASCRFVARYASNALTAIFTIGSFGGKHIDDNDSAGGFTSMVTYGDIAPDENPGMFIVGDLGVAVGTRIVTHRTIGSGTDCA